MKKINIFVVATIFLLPISAKATTYYFDGSIANDCSGGAGSSYDVSARRCTASNGTKAWNDLASANSTLKAGDTLYMRGGTSTYEVYDVTTASGAGEGIQPDNSGTGPNNVITYSTYQNEKLHLRGVADSGTACYGILYTT